MKEIYINDWSREDWLDERKKGIGGSDAAALVGLSAYSSPLSIYADKMGLVDNDVDNEAMRIGRDLEDYVAKRFEEETKLKTRNKNAILISEENPFMRANIDKAIVGIKAGLECKTTNAFNKTDFEGGNIPDYYYCQCQHYMAVTGYSKWYLAVLVLGRSFHWFEIERNEDDIAALIEIEKCFWEENILKQEAPDPIENDGDLLKELYPEADNDQEIALYGKENSIKSLINIKEQIKELDTKKKFLENQIKGELGEAASGFTNNYQIMWKNRVSNRIDTKKLKKEQPYIYQQYLKQSNTRTLTIKEVS
jgi:putative phage-type endonuclease